MRKSTSGEELAKVLWYYNLLPSTFSSSQKIVCPFHNDVNPSMIVNLKEGNWFCFGCGLSGDARTFVKILEKKHNKINDLQAYKKFLKILKSDKCSHINIKRVLTKNKPISRDLYNEAYDYYHGLKKIDWENSSDEDIESAKSYMIKRGFSPKALNLCKAKITYNKSYEIIFPMFDNKKFKGWVCRTTNKEIESKRKYLYNEGFSRATTLVGDYGKKDYVFVVEGYMDRLKFLQFNETNVVAILGWKMSQQQIQKLKENGVTKIISALDNDTHGRKGTKYLEQHFKVIRFKYLKGIKDPGDMTKELFNKMYSKTLKELEGVNYEFNRQVKTRRKKVRSK